MEDFLTYLYEYCVTEYLYPANFQIYSNCIAEEALNIQPFTNNAVQTDLF